MMTIQDFVWYKPMLATRPQQGFGEINLDQLQVLKPEDTEGTEQRLTSDSQDGCQETVQSHNKQPNKLPNKTF